MSILEFDRIGLIVLGTHDTQIVGKGSLSFGRCKLHTRIKKSALIKIVFLRITDIGQKRSRTKYSFDKSTSFIDFRTGSGQEIFVRYKSSRKQPETNNAPKNISNIMPSMTVEPRDHDEPRRQRVKIML